MDSKKYQLIQTQIQEARTALQTWNDRRAEAMIELDSLFMEIEELKQQAIVERNANLETVSTLKAELEKSDREFHRQFEAYTNDFQVLKIENEGLQNQLKQARIDLDAAQKDFAKKEKDYQSRILKINQESEVRSADQQYQMKSQISTLASELQAIRNEKNSITQKAEKYEKELHVIRKQMMSFLNVTQEVSAPAMETASKAVPASTSRKLQEPELIVDQVSNSPVTVQDYLKRFGY